MSPAPASLPFVDEHSVAIEADREASWVSLQRVLEATGSAGFALVIRSRAHVLATRRILSAVKRAAERR